MANPPLLTLLANWDGSPMLLLDAIGLGFKILGGAHPRIPDHGVSRALGELPIPGCQFA